MSQENVSRIRSYESVEELVSQTMTKDPDQRAADYVIVALDADVPFDSTSKDFRSIEETVLFLKAGTPVFNYDDAVLAIVEGGAMLAAVGDDGALTFPVLDGAEQLRADSGLTVETLRNASKRDG